MVIKSIAGTFYSIFAFPKKTFINTFIFNLNPDKKMGKALQLSAENFDATINGDKPVLVDFWAEWCGPCKMIGPLVEELAAEYEGKAVIAKRDVDQNPDLASRFGVRSIPTLLFFKGGQIVDKQIGLVPKAVLAQKLTAQF